LLDIFWESHNPTVQSWSQQYKTAVFYHNEEQKRLSEESRDMMASSLSGKVVTRMLPFTGFQLAEGYHQKYKLKNHMSILHEFEAKYPDVEGMVSSTAAARLNGYLGGNGTCEQLKAEISGFGLSDVSKKALLEEVCQGIIGKTCPTNNCA
jgi:hypothetical protein